VIQASGTAPAPTSGKALGTTGGSHFLRQHALFLCALAFLAIFYVSTIREGQDWGDDFAQYILHARNLVHGTDYSATGLIINPRVSVGPKRYPPVTPLLLSLPYLWFGPNLYPMKCVMVLCLLGFVLVVYALLLRRIPKAGAVQVALLVGLNPYFWRFKDQIESDLPFAAFSCLGLYVYELFESREREGRGGSLWRAVLLGASIYLAYATRVLGLVLLPTIVVYELIRYRRLSRTILSASGIALVLVALQYVLLGPSEYPVAPEMDQFVWWRTPLENGFAYLKDSIRLWENGQSAIFTYAVYLALLLAAALGFLAVCKRSISCAEVFVVLYTAAVIANPYVQGVRYVIPVIPFFLYYAYQGIQVFSSQRYLAAPLRHAWVLLLGVVIASYAGAYRVEHFGAMTSGAGVKDFGTLCTFIRERTNPNARIIFRKPRAFALYTERSAATYDPHASPASIWSFITEKRMNYVVVGNALDGDFRNDTAVLLPAIRARSGCIDKVYENPTFQLYAVKLDCSELRSSSN
jgi:hypothetical protein